MEDTLYVRMLREIRVTHLRSSSDPHCPIAALHGQHDNLYVDGQIGRHAAALLWAECWSNERRDQAPGRRALADDKGSFVERQGDEALVPFGQTIPP